MNADDRPSAQGPAAPPMDGCEWPPAAQRERWLAVPGESRADMTARGMSPVSSDDCSISGRRVACCTGVELPAPCTTADGEELFRIGGDGR